MIKRESLFSTGGMSQSDRCLHTPGSFAKENLLYVQEVGNLRSLKPHKCVRENLDSFPDCVGWKRKPRCKGKTLSGTEGKLCTN